MTVRTFDVSDAVLVVIDVQERLVATMDQREQVIATTSRLVRVAEALGVPVVYTEQYPDGLGPTVAALSGVLASAIGPIVKSSFDACAEPGFVEALQATGRRQVALTGMEAHICVAQTALHLLEDGYRVHVVADAVCSADERDGVIALQRLRSAGAEVTTSESVIYEAVGAAGTDRFRAVLAIVKEKAADK